MSDTDFSEAEIRAFSEKLHAWGGTLEAGERALLRALLVSADEGSEVEGFNWRGIPADQFHTGTPSGPGPIPPIADQSFAILKPLAGGGGGWITRAYADTWKPIG